MTLPSNKPSSTPAKMPAHPARETRQHPKEAGKVNMPPTTGEPTIRKTALRNPHNLCSEGAKFIKTYLRARRDREWQFPRGLFSDPAWDILLDLYVAQAENRQVSVWNAYQAGAVRESSGMRWLQILESRHLVERQQDEPDQNIEWVILTRDAIAGMNRWLDRMHPLSAAENPDS